LLSLDPSKRPALVFKAMASAPIHIPGTLKKVAKVFSDASFQCWLVGGAIRDGLLGRKSYDYDLATDAAPKEVIKLFRRTIPTGIRHGTVSILLGRYQFQTTSFRREESYSDGRHPDKVSFSGNIDSDLARRDFTVNAMAWDLINSKFFDPHRGRDDLDKRLLRAIGNPEERFQEDGLRSIRACRFASQLGFHIHQATLNAIGRARSNIEGLSAERIWEEIKKILQTEKPSVSFLMFKKTGLIEMLFPEFNIQSASSLREHEETDFLISLRACDLANPANFSLRAAALFHRLGHSAHPTKSEDSSFLRSAGMARLILKRYRAPNAENSRIISMLSNLCFQYSNNWSDAKVRRFVSRIGVGQIHDLIELKNVTIRANLSFSGFPHKYPKEGPGNRIPISESARQLQDLNERVNSVIELKVPLAIGDLAIDGNQIMDNCRVRSGPKLGELLKFLLESVLENPKKNSSDQLLWLSRSWLSKHP